MFLQGPRNKLPSPSLPDSLLGVIFRAPLTLHVLLDCLTETSQSTSNSLQLIFRFLVSVSSHGRVCVPERCSDAKVRFSFTRYKSKFHLLLPLRMTLYLYYSFIGPRSYLDVFSLYQTFTTYTRIFGPSWAQFYGLLLNNNFHSILFLSLFSLLSGWALGLVFALLSVQSLGSAQYTILFLSLFSLLSGWALGLGFVSPSRPSLPRSRPLDRLGQAFQGLGPSIVSAKPSKVSSSRPYRYTCPQAQGQMC